MSPMIGRSADAVWRRTFDAIIVARGSEVVALEGAAWLIWELLDEPRTRGELVADLANLHDLMPADVAGDVDVSLETLVRAGFVVEHARPVPRSDALARTVLPGRPIIDHPAAALAAWGLGPQVHMPDVDSVGWPALVASITRERLTGIAFGAVRAGDLALAAEQRSELAALHRAAMVVAVRTERLLLEIVDLLGSAGIAALVHKGPSLAHVAYDDPAHRPFGDIDLLVRSRDVETTFAALAANGFARRFSEPRPGFDRRFGKGAAFVTPDGLEIDVHRTFASGPFGLTVDLDAVHRAAEPLRVADRSIGTLSRSHRFVAVAMHAALGSRFPRLLNLRDIAQLLADADLDHAEVVAVARAWQVDAPVALAVRMTAETFALDSGAHLFRWAAAHEAPRRQRRALEAYTSSSRGYSRQALVALRVIPGISQKARYLRAMVLPDRSYEAQRGEHRVARWRRLVRTAVHR